MSHNEPPRLSKTPVAGILALITALTDEQANMFWSMLDAAMWDEWDCSLNTGFEMFGVDELRVVTRTATIMAQHAEEHPSGT
jgi:hypothetical protein